MKNTLILLFINIFLVLLNEAFLPNLFPSYLIPIFPLAFSLGILFLGIEEKAYISAFIGGLVMDLLGFGIIGESSLILTILVFLMILSRRYFSKSVLANLVTVFVINLIYHYFSTVNFQFEFLYHSLNSMLLLTLSLLFSMLIKYFRRSNNWK